MVMLSKNIYPIEPLLESIMAFKPVCNIVVSEDDAYWILHFSDYCVDKTTLVQEFCNYLLEVINRVIM